MRRQRRIADVSMERLQRPAVAAQAHGFRCPVRAGGVGGVCLWLRAARGAPAQRGDPRDRAVDDPADLPGIGGDPAAPGLAVAAADPGAADDRRRRLRLCADPLLALYRQRSLRSRQGRQRNRLAVLSDDRLCRAARPRGVGGDLDRRHGSPARRQAMAAAASPRLRDRGARGHPLLLSGQARAVAADDHGRALVVAARLSAFAVALWRARASGAAMGRRARSGRGAGDRIGRGGLFPARLPRPADADIGHQSFARDRHPPGGHRAGDRARGHRRRAAAGRSDPAGKRRAGSARPSRRQPSPSR